MSKFFNSLKFDLAGSAAVEMALVTPMLLVIMFGSFELGNYFMDNHIVAKAVRDGARYAARLPMNYYSCPSGQANGTLVNGASLIKNVTRTGRPDGTGALRLGNWTNDTTITITVSCQPVTTYAGIYTVGMTGDVPVVTVAAVLPYSTLFGKLGWQITSRQSQVSTLNLNAQSQAAVTGV